MKRKEFYGMDQFVEKLKPILENADCDICPAANFCTVNRCTGTCTSIIKDWLDEELKTKPRFMTYETKEAFTKACLDSCESDALDLIKWLSEEIEIENNCKNN